MQNVGDNTIRPAGEYKHQAHAGDSHADEDTPAAKPAAKAAEQHRQQTSSGFDEERHSYSRPKTVAKPALPVRQNAQDILCHLYPYIAVKPTYLTASHTEGIFLIDVPL
jgi:hypothetical protein